MNNLTVGFELFYYVFISLCAALVLNMSFLEKRFKAPVTVLILFVFRVLSRIAQFLSEQYGFDISTVCFMVINSFLFMTVLFFVAFKSSLGEIAAVVVFNDIIGSLPLTIARKTVEKLNPVAAEDLNSGIYITKIQIKSAGDFAIAVIIFLLASVFVFLLMKLFNKLSVKINFKSKFAKIFGIAALAVFFCSEVGFSITYFQKTNFLGVNLYAVYGIICFVYVTAVCAVLIIRNDIKSRNLKNKMAVINAEEKANENYYREVERKNNELLKMKENMLKHLDDISCLAENRDKEKLCGYIAKLTSDNSKKRYVFSGNLTADAVIYDIASKCNEQGIEFLYSGIIPEDIKIDDVSLTCVMYNILMNAYEGALRSEQAQKKYISFSANFTGGSLVLSCKNSKNSKEKPNKDKLSTTKKEAGHGYGIKIIKDIVEDYSGVFNIKSAENEFEVDLMLIAAAVEPNAV